MKTKFTYTGIRVMELGRSVEFYTMVLGMKETGRSRIEQTGGEAISLITHEGGPTLELNDYPSRSRFGGEYAEGEAMDHLAFQVDDLDSALSEAPNAGYETALEMKTEKSRWAYIKDPNGIFIELFA